ncbi:unnamed protein product, partial [Discosporangium mesarthrocarpum]
ITAIDFSKDGDWVRSTCEGGQLHFWDSNKGKHQSNVTKYKDLVWATETCTFSWPTAGVFPGLDDGTEIASVDRSCNGLFLAVGDTFGRLRLFRYPCPAPRPPPSYHELRGHGAGPVTRARFLAGGKFLVSVGARDRCVLQWELTGPGAETDASKGELKDPAEAVVEEESDGYVLDMQDGSDLERQDDFEAATNEMARLVSHCYVLIVEQGRAKANTIVSKPGKKTPKPWEQATVAPTRPPPADRAPPADGLELEWVHGYRGRDSRNNAAYAGSAGGRAVYTAGSVGVSLDLTNKTQSFQLGHVGSCISLAVSPDGLHVATGEISRKPTVIVWEADSTRAIQASLCTLSGFHKRAVVSLAFSPDGVHLATQGCDDDHSLAVYDWRNRLLKAKAKGSRRKSLCVAWNSNGQRLVTCGLRHISFWSFGDRNLGHARGVLGTKGRQQTMPCCAFMGNTAVVGTGDGHLYVFKEGSTTLTRSVKAHTGSVYSLHVTTGHREGSIGLWSGGKDGMVKLFDEEMKTEKEFSIATIETNGAGTGAALAAPIAGGGGGKKKGGKRGGSIDPAVRTLFATADGQSLLVGTRGGELYEMSTVDGSDNNGAPLTSGHGTGEVWGVAAHPTKPLYATCGDDCSVRLWSLHSTEVVLTMRMDTSARAICFSPDGDSLAVGCGGGKGKADAVKSGTFLILKVDNLALKHEGKVRPQP